jgi:hypothetical protein
MTIIQNAEHLTTSHNACRLTGNVAVSFVIQGAAADGKQIGTLTPGPSDGFEKVVIYQGGLPGCSLRVQPSMASGATYWDIADGDFGGAAVLRWNASLGQWWLAGGIHVTPGVVP